MGRRRPIFRDVLGALKDKASLSRAAILSKTGISFAVLQATSHEPCNPADEKHIRRLLSFGRGSRITASSCIGALMDRLHNTTNSSVSLKCLIAIHNIIRRGTFILQDQLSIYPSTGGRNYLNLSNFRDDSSLESWHLSLWVRWYARALEQILFASRVLGFFLSSPSSNDDAKGEEEEKVTSLSNADILKEIDSLVAVVEEISKAPDYAAVRENRVVAEVMRLVGKDNLTTQKEIQVRLMEMRERMGSLSFSDSVEFACVLKRLENCKDRLLFLMMDEKMKAGDGLLGLIWEMKKKVGVVEEVGQGRRLTGGARRSESARLSYRALIKSADSAQFSSGRLEGWFDS